MSSNSEARERRMYGFSAVEIVIVIAVVLAIAAVGFFVMTKDDTPKATDNTGTEDTSITVPAAPAINTTSDLTEAEKTLDATDVDEGTADEAELEGEMNRF